MTKLQNKTALRNKINNNFDTMLTKDVLHVYNDGSWQFLSCNSDVYHSPQYRWVSQLGRIAEETTYSGGITNKVITEFFKQIEKDINN